MAASRGQNMSLGVCLSLLLSGLAAGQEQGIARVQDLAAPVMLMSGDRPLEVEGYATPYCADMTGDGKIDLLVGQYGLGRMRIYPNAGTATVPRFDGFDWFVANDEFIGVPVCCQVTFTPQLIDFDRDGRDDILTGSGFEGEVFLFRRQPDQSFAAAEVLENRQGEVHLHRWSLTRQLPRRYNVAAHAYDWDADGDLDLILGYAPLCLVLNEGSDDRPSYDEGRLILCDDEPIVGGLSSPQMADWDNDGLDDLITGQQRSIVWYRNRGTPGNPVFESARRLVSGPHSPDYSGSEAHEKAIHHALCVADLNGDGKLDLIVGDRFRRRVHTDGAAGSNSIVDNAARREILDEIRDLRKTPENETRPQRIARYRQVLAKWQEFATLYSPPNAARGFEHGGHVWYYRRR